MVTQAPAPVQYLRHSLLFLRKIHSEQTGDQNMNNTVWKSLGPEEIAHWTMSLRVWKHSLGRGSYSRASKTANLFGRTLTRSILWRPRVSKSPPPVAAPRGGAAPRIRPDRGGLSMLSNIQPCSGTETSLWLWETKTETLIDEREH